MKRFNHLNHEEKRVILEKGTEMPYTGEYEKEKRIGVYVCRQCGSPLYLSNHKFDSGCGWPSFDDEIPGKVTQVLDADGRRTEIICTSCHGHLGHVFFGERFTEKNTRHCVNSLSLRFLSAYTPEGYEKAIVAGGCFWGVEKLFEEMKGVIKTTCGYTGGQVANPTYEEVCTGLTRHVESVEIIFDPKQITYETIIRHFFEIHDPTQVDGQGPDIGQQYLSAIFYFSKEQEKVAKDCKQLLIQKRYKVVTQILPASIFYPAENEHQHYYTVHHKEPYCHVRVKRF